MTTEVQTDQSEAALRNMVSVPEVTAVALALTDETALEAFVGSLPADQVPVYLARLLGAATNIRALTKGFERRLEADGQTGQHFTVGGVEYGFYGALQKGWKDIPGLFSELRALGISEISIAEATSEVRVTELREAARFLSDKDRSKEALEVIEDHRIAKGERGTPSFRIVVEGRP